MNVVTIDLACLMKWKDKGWELGDPHEWTPGLNGMEYRVWRRYSPGGGPWTGEQGYLESAEGLMKPIGPMTVIGRTREQP